jgi:hypothetical protein
MVAHDGEYKRALLGRHSSALQGSFVLVSLLCKGILQCITPVQPVRASLDSWCTSSRCM